MERSLRGSRLQFSREEEGKGVLIKMKMCVRYRGDEVGEEQEKLLSLGQKVSALHDHIISTENPRVLQRQR